MFRFAKKIDYVYMILGTIGALANGASLPLLALFWGDMINNFDTIDM